MKWLHISDIHYDSINDGIKTMMLRKNFEEIVKKHNLLVDNVFFTGDFRCAENQEKQNIDLVAEEAVDFLRLIASLVGVTDDSYIHIVPGNHDLDYNVTGLSDAKSKKILIEAVESYNGNFLGSAKNRLRERFAFFEKCAKLLNNNVWKNFCDGCIHRYRVFDEYSIIYLNSAIACGQEIKRGNLLIGTVDLFNVMSDIKKYNDGKPIIFLAHHPMEVFSIEEITTIKDIINDVNLPSLWLCGDLHDMLENKTYEIAQITTGCFRKEPGVEAGFYIGEFLPLKGVRFKAYLGSKRGKWDYSESYSKFANDSLPQALCWEDDIYPDEYLIASQYAKQGDYKTAISLCLNAIGQGSVDKGVLMKMKLSLGYWYCWIDENENAIATLIALIDYFENQQDEENLALCHNYIGLAYDEMKRWPESEYYYLQARNIYKVLETRSNTPLKVKMEIHQCYVNMGLMYFRWGRGLPSKNYFGNAKSYYEKGLPFFEKNENRYPYEASTAYNQYALFCDNQKEYLLAIDYYKNALSIKSKTVGQWHRSCARIYANIGLAYFNLKNYTEALEHCKIAERIYNNNNEPQSRDALRNLGTIAAISTQKGEYVKALGQFKELLSIRVKRFGSNDTDVAQTFHNMGKTYYDMGDFVKALEYLKEAFVIRDEKIPTHRYTIETIRRIAETHEQLSNYDMASFWYRKAETRQNGGHC